MSCDAIRPVLLEYFKFQCPREQVTITGTVVQAGETMGLEGTKEQQTHPQQTAVTPSQPIVSMWEIRT